MHDFMFPRVRAAPDMHSVALRFLLAIVLAGGIYHAAPTSQADSTDLLRQTVKILTAVGNGSGSVIYSGKGYSLILTNWHVAEDPPLIVVSYTYDRSGAVRRAHYERATLVRRSDYDLALLRIEREMPFVAALAAALPLPDTPVIAVGAQKGLRPLMTHGHLASQSNQEGYLVSSAPLAPGVSGGGYYALIDGRYRLIGVPTAVRTEPTSRYSSQILPHLGLGVPIGAVREFLSGVEEFRGIPVGVNLMSNRE